MGSLPENQRPLAVSSQYRREKLNQWIAAPKRFRGQPQSAADVKPRRNCDADCEPVGSGTYPSSCAPPSSCEISPQSISGSAGPTPASGSNTSWTNMGCVADRSSQSRVCLSPRGWLLGPSLTRNDLWAGRPVAARPACDAASAASGSTSAGVSGSLPVSIEVAGDSLLWRPSESPDPLSDRPPEPVSDVGAVIGRHACV